MMTRVTYSNWFWVIRPKVKVEFGTVFKTFKAWYRLHIKVLVELNTVFKYVIELQDIFWTEIVSSTLSYGEL